MKMKGKAWNEIGTAAIIIITGIAMIATAGEAQLTIGTCLDTSTIRYNTTYTLDGVLHSMTYDVVCENGCMAGATDYGDDCQSLKGSDAAMPLMPLVLWLFSWVFAIYFRKVYDSYLVQAFMMLLIALSGLLITSHILMLVPIFITSVMVIHALTSDREWRKTNWQQK